MAFAAVVAAAVGALAITPFLIPPDVVRDAVKAEIRNVTGLDPVLRGPVSVALFPTGRVLFEDVSLGDGRSGFPALSAERIVARLRFIPLLAGRFEIADISIEQPTVNVTVDANGRTNWTPYIDTLAGALKPHAQRQPTFSEMRVNGGTIVVRSASDGSAETLTEVDLALAWPSISKSFGATGRFKFRGENVEAALSLGDFVAALTGARSGVKLRLAGPRLNFAFDGYLSARPTLRMEGTLAADTASLRDTMTWLNQQPPPGSGFGRFSLKAQTTVNGGALSLANANIELDGNTAEGVLMMSADGRTLQGTLASNSLDLSPYVSTIRLLTGAEAGWNKLPIRLHGLKGADLDLRLSAAKVSLGAAKLGRTALAANLRNGRLTIAVGEAQAYDGVILGSFELADSNAGADVKAQLQFAGVDLERCLSDMFGVRRLEGNGNLSFTVEASGASIYALARSLTGTVALTAKGGNISGVNVEQLLRRLERRPLSGSGDFRTGRTPFDNLTMAIKLAVGTAVVSQVQVEGPTVRVALGGTASISERDLDLKGTASLISAPGSAAGGTFDLPFIIQGRWDDPLMLPDPESLIRRSGAAAPLLNAIRNRAARDALRPAVERLSGANVSTEAPAPVAAEGAGR